MHIRKGRYPRREHRKNFRNQIVFFASIERHLQFSHADSSQENAVETIGNRRDLKSLLEILVRLDGTKIEVGRVAKLEYNNIGRRKV